MSENLNWNFEEFTTFLLLFAADVDMEITKEETDLIKKRIPEKSYDSIKSLFDQSNDYERIQTIMKYKGLYFPTQDRARELIAMIIKLFNVDGHFSRLEQNSVRVLKRLI